MLPTDNMRTFMFNPYICGPAGYVTVREVDSGQVTRAFNTLRVSSLAKVVSVFEKVIKDFIPNSIFKTLDNLEKIGTKATRVSFGYDRERDELRNLSLKLRIEFASSKDILEQLKYLNKTPFHALPIMATRIISSYILQKPKINTVRKFFEILNSMSWDENWSAISSTELKKISSFKGYWELTFGEFFIMCSILDNIKNHKKDFSVITSSGEIFMPFSTSSSITRMKIPSLEFQIDNEQEFEREKAVLIDKINDEGLGSYDVGLNNFLQIPEVYRKNREVIFHILNKHGGRVLSWFNEHLRCDLNIIFTAACSYGRVICFEGPEKLLIAQDRYKYWAESYDLIDSKDLFVDKILKAIEYIFEAAVVANDPTALDLIPVEYRTNSASGKTKEACSIS